MEQQSKLFISNSLETLLKNKVHLFANSINQGQGIDSKEGLIFRHSLIETLDKERKSPNPESNKFLQNIAESLLKKNYFAVSIYNSLGIKLAHAGQFSTNPKLRIPLNSVKSSFLIWNEGFILNTSNDIYIRGAYIGKIVTEKSMPLLTHAFEDVASIGKTGEFAICKLLEKDTKIMQCLVNGFAGKKFFQAQPRLVKGKALPMNYALEGKAGLIYTHDYRKEDVVAAYSPIEPLGLGIVIKVDLNELYSPITHQLEYIVPALISLVFIGGILFRWLVTPLVRNLVQSEQETKNTNIKLEKSKMRYQLVLDNSPYCIHEIDNEGRLTSINPTGLKMLEFQSKSEIKNKAYIDCVSDKDKSRVTQLMDAGLQGKQSDFEFIGANGKTYQSLFVPIQDEQSGALRLMGWTQDITKRKENEEQLRLSQKMDALGKLTGGIAHDYNNILGIILGFSELLKEKLVSEPELLEYAKHIFNAGERGSKLTKKLLSFSKNKPYDAESLNINTVLLEHKNMLEKTLTARIKLEFNLAGNLWFVKLDRSSLENVILNLSINAMHAMEQGGKLTFATHNESVSAADAIRHQMPAGDYVLLSLTDTGIGMDETTKNRMFEPFFTTKGERGTGLGLSQVYGFIQSNNGQVKVYSEQSQGTNIVIYFPRDMTAEETKSAIKTQELSNLNGSETILIVDDEQGMITITSNILTSHGYYVLTATDGENALAVLENNAVDLLLSDVIMPNMDGGQLAEKVKKRYPHIKIQLVSGYSDKANNEKIDEVLQAKILKKPFTSQSLLNQIRALLDE